MTQSSFATRLPRWEHAGQPFFSSLRRSTSFPRLTVQNAASGTAGTVAPGEIVTLQGYGLGPATAAIAPSQAPVDQLGGTQVTFGGVAAPIFSAQAQQVTVQVPWEIAGQTSTEVVVTYNGGPPAGTSSSVPVVVATAAPGIFAVANSDGTLNSSTNLANAGGFITIYGTGGGVTSPLGITEEHGRLLQRFRL